MSLRNSSAIGTIVLAVCLAAACAQKRSVAPLIWSTAWVQTSAEYEGVSRQAYRTAARMLEQALADSTWTAALEQTGSFGALPPAIIVDVDETVLDNSAFEAQMVKAGILFDQAAFDAWVERAIAPPVPGALEFATAAAQRGVTFFYVSNRGTVSEAATRENLRRAGFPLAETDDVVPANGERPEWTSDKSSRRAWIAERYRVLLVIGDDFNDFVFARVSLAERERLSLAHADRWGRQWIILPNPMYGSWENALYDWESGLTDEDKIRRVIERLDPAE